MGGHFVSRPVALVLALSVLLSVGSCSSSDQKGELQWVAGLRPGDCVDPGTRASAAIARTRVVPCHERHAMEVYARLPYPPASTAPATPIPSTSTPSTSAASTAPAAPASSSEYPGRDVLQTFAREACAERFRAYLGSNSLKPWYFLTYLFPSVSSWTAASAQRPKLGPLARLVTSSVRSDRSVVCFVRTTGPALTASVRGPVATPTSVPATTGSAPASGSSGSIPSAVPERIENS